MAGGGCAGDLRQLGAAAGGPTSIAESRLFCLRSQSLHLHEVGPARRVALQGHALHGAARHVSS